MWSVTLDVVVMDNELVYVITIYIVKIESIKESAKNVLKIPAAFLNEESIHESLVIQITQPWTGTSRLSLFLDCAPLGLVTLSSSLRNMMNQVKPPLVHAVSSFFS